jgi:hypothetical protein
VLRLTDIPPEDRSDRNQPSHDARSDHPSERHPPLHDSPKDTPTPNKHTRQQYIPSHEQPPHPLHVLLRSSRSAVSTEHVIEDARKGEGVEGREEEEEGEEDWKGDAGDWGEKEEEEIRGEEKREEHWVRGRGKRRGAEEEGGVVLRGRGRQSGIGWSSGCHGRRSELDRGMG